MDELLNIIQFYIKHIVTLLLFKMLHNSFIIRFLNHVISGNWVLRFIMFKSLNGG